MKRSLLYVSLAGLIAVIYTSCHPTPIPDALQVNCFDTEGTFICFDDEARKATYSRWNLDTVLTFNAFNIQGSYPPVPGTTGNWTTVGITLVTSTAGLSLEMGSYNYSEILADDSMRQFNFWVRRFTGDDQDPDILDYEYDPNGTATLTLTSVSPSFELTGLFEADIQGVIDPNNKAFIRYRFTDIPAQ